MNKKVIALLLILLVAINLVVAQESITNKKSSKKSGHFINLHSISFSGETKEKITFHNQAQRDYFLHGINSECNQTQVATDLYDVECILKHEKSSKDSLNYGLQIGYKFKNLRISLLHLSLKHGNTTTTQIAGEYLYKGFLIGAGRGQAQTDLLDGKELGFSENITLDRGSSLLFLIGYQKIFKKNLSIGINYFQITNKFKGRGLTPYFPSSINSTETIETEEAEVELTTSFLAFNLGYAF